MQQEEIRQQKLEALRKDLQIVAEQLQNGQYTEYDDTTLPTLLEKIRGSSVGGMQWTGLDGMKPL